MTELVANFNPVRLAIIGAGIYARDAHIPSLLSLSGLFDIVAVYSRTVVSAQSRIEQLQPHQENCIDLYTDIDAVLQRKDVEAVDIVLPIHLMPRVIVQAFAEGKHVMSEKPAAPDVATGRRLLSKYAQYPNLVWMVAENWRYESAFRLAIEMVQGGEIGPVLTCHWALHLPITPDNKYYQSEWRREGVVPGGWIMDGSVHHVAVLRALIGEIDHLYAVATMNSPIFTSLDTLSATLYFRSGAVGSYLVSYTAKAAWPPELFVVGERGSLRIDRGQLIVTKNGTEPQIIPCRKFDGVEQEFIAFATAIRHQASHMNMPADRLQDVAVVEAMLRSATEQQPINLIR